MDPTILGVENPQNSKKCTNSFSKAPSDSFKLNDRYPLLYKKQINHATDTRKVTLDNPAVLEQQLEVLAHHKRQLERKGLLSQNKLEPQELSTNVCVPKLSSTSLVDNYKKSVEHSTEMCRMAAGASLLDKTHSSEAHKKNPNAPSTVLGCELPFEKSSFPHEQSIRLSIMHNLPLTDNVYTNIKLEEQNAGELLDTTCTVLDATNIPYNTNGTSPPSPVSSSYSELRRATHDYLKKSTKQGADEDAANYATNYIEYNQKNMGAIKGLNTSNGQIYANYNSCQVTSSNQSLQGSTTYESIYEPINPQPSSQLRVNSPLLVGSTYSNISAQVVPNQSQQMLDHADMVTIDSSSELSLSTLGNDNLSSTNTSLYAQNVDGRNVINSRLRNKHGGKEDEVDALTTLLMNSLDVERESDSYGICYKCNERVLGENTGCTAMEHIYHIDCFTCSQCQINLQGKPFYALEGKPYCEYDYMQTLEKCSVCVKPILERILRATGKPYHPQCFTCVVCGNSLDGIPFTVDATNQIYCIQDFHRKFAPRCCVCKEPIMPERGEEETVRVVALDRSFHFECYKCEDCGLLLSSDAEGRGCYPLDNHVLCKSCNAKRVQMLTNCMASEI